MRLGRPEKRGSQGTGTDEKRTDASGGAADASISLELPLELSVGAIAFSSEHGRSSL